MEEEKKSCFEAKGFSSKKDCRMHVSYPKSKDQALKNFETEEWEYTYRGEEGEEEARCPILPGNRSDRG